MPTTFPCTSVNPHQQGDVSVGYGRANQAGLVEARARTDAERVADRDALAKARNEYACQKPCGIPRGEATNKHTTIEVPEWQDGNGIFHATAKCKWHMTVHCEMSVAAKGKKRKPAKRGKARSKSKRRR